MLSEWDVVARVGAAAVLGGFIGYDRQIRNKPAGVRTHMLVSAGSALLVATSVLVLADTTEVGSSAQAMRVVAGVVTGIGFLGAGSILVRGDRVEGLTTAAGIWVTAAVGVAIGFGLWIVGGLTTLMVIVVQAVSFVAEWHSGKRDAPATTEASAEVSEG